MTDQTSEMPVAKPPFWKRHPRKLIVLAVFLLLCSQMPLLGYLGRVFQSVLDFGFSPTAKGELEKHTDWFKRYFTGPPSDAEMIAHFKKHRVEFERLAYLTVTQGFCHGRERERPGQECTKLEEKVGMRGGLYYRFHLSNSALRDPRSRTCFFPCGVQDFDYPNMEWQQWWGTKNPKIETWSKELIYVPPLLPAELFGLDPKSYPTDLITAVRKGCFLKESLDSIPPELEADPGFAGEPKCAVRHIEGQWFLKLNPHNVIDF